MESGPTIVPGLFLCVFLLQAVKLVCKLKTQCVERVFHARLYLELKCTSSVVDGRYYSTLGVIKSVLALFNL